jgi:hypothetical protein
MQVSWSPIASCSSAAATAESTPPERPHTTLALPPDIVGDRGVGCRFAGGYRAKAGRQRLDPVAVAHPYLLAPGLGPQTIEQVALVEDVDKGPSEFLMVAQTHPATELGAHRLHAVTNAENRHAEPEHDLRRAW